MGISSILTVDSSDQPLGLASLPFIDLRFLSQPELRSLALCRDDTFDLRRLDDVVAPAIDRSIFNESAGSRKQTYSCRRFALLPLPSAAVAGHDDDEDRENKQIVHSLSHILSQRRNPQTPTLAHGNVPPSGAGECRRSPGKRREKASAAAIVVYENECEVVNRSGVVVDVEALEEREDPFGDELRRRTEGLETEEEVLGFLNGLEGQWGSRRKKRKIVDAGDFGDELPVGWKLLLGLRRREGRVSLYCRRYISPNGQQFMSCKEVSSYLLPFVQHQEASQPISGHIDENTQETCHMVTESTAGAANRASIGMEARICYSATPISSISTDYEKQIVLFRIENPAKAQLRNLLECRRCNLTFGDKDSYVQHLLSFHKRNAKRCRVGKSIADGVIIKDGKFECQFCHKTFDEKRRYNSHVGIHVRDYDKSLESLPDDIIVQTYIEPTALVLMPSAITEMNALVETGIAKDTIPATSMAKSSSEPDGSPHIKHAKEDREIGVTQSSDPLETLASTSVDEQDNGCNPLETLASTSVDGQDNGCKMFDDTLGKIAKTNNTSDDKINNCMDTRISISSKAANITDDVYCDKGLPGCMLDENNKSGKDQNSIGRNTNVPANERTDGTDKCDDSNGKGLSPWRMLGENDRSGNGEEKGTKSDSDMLHDNKPDHGSDNTSSNKDLSSSNVLDENDKSSNEQENRIGSYPDVPSNRKPSDADTFMNEMSKSSNELDSAFENCSIILPDSGQTCGIETSVEDILNSTMKEAGLNDMEKFHNGMESDLGSCHPKCDKDLDAQIIGNTDVENVLQNEPSDTSSLLLQSLGCFPSIDMISYKGDDFSSISQKLGNISDFNGLGLDEIEPPNFGFATGQDSSTLPETPMDLAAYGADLEQGLVPSISFEWDSVSQLSLKMGSKHRFTSICVWCQREFSHEDVNLQSDSVGFICSTCKAKISGQLNVLDNGFFLNSNQL